MTKRVLILWLLAVSASTSLLAADRNLARGDLARALRRFEAAWDERRADLPEETKARVTGLVTKATFGFFSQDYETSTGELARATAALLETEPSVEALSLKVSAIASARSGSLLVSLARPGSLASGKIEGEIVLVGPDGRVAARAALVLEAAASEVRGTLDLARTTAGRSTLVLSVGARRVERRPLAVLDDLAPRLARLDASLGKLEHRRAPTLLARRARIDRALSWKKDDGVDRDYEAEVVSLESDVAALARGADPFTGRPGDELRVASVEGKRVVYRLVVSRAAATRKSAPLVIALHGVGGDEDMFCEAYGNGIVRRLAVEAGALFAAPRSPGGFGATGEHALTVLDDIARDYDVGSVYLVGHSMGAAQAVDALARRAERFKAAALFGGPGGPSTVKIGVPLFVAVGSDDFARGGAKAFADKARRAGTNVLFEERKGLEHLLIVREAAPEAFRFFKENGLVPPRRFY